MYKSLHIRSFRCFKDLRLNELSPVNLIVGQNNVGKTALLEAIFVHSGVTNPELALRLGSYRGMMSGYKFPPGPPFPWDTLFRNLDPSVPIEIASIDENGHSRRSQLTVLRGPLRRVRAAKDDEMVSARSATTEERTYGLMLESHQPCSCSHMGVAARTRCSGSAIFW